jgi:Sec-independent protein translocase protein TatA
MDILGIGPLELLFIFLIALIILGPKDMVKAGRSIGSFLRKIVTHPTWRTVQQASKEIRVLPNRLMREAGLDDLENPLNDIKNITQDPELDKLDNDLKSWQEDISSWTTPAPSIDPPKESTSTQKTSEPSDETPSNDDQG